MDTKCPCRLCGKQVSKPLINIFDSNNNYAKKINALLPVYVHEDDCLPKCMCNDCHDNLLKLHKFYLTTLETDIELKSQLPWMQKRLEETHVGIPMVQYLNSKTLTIATDLENYSCYSSSKLPEYDLIKTLDSNLVSVPVSSCPCSYSCSNCLHLNVEDPNADFDQSIDEDTDSENKSALDPLATEIPVDVKDLNHDVKNINRELKDLAQDNFICSNLNIFNSDVKSSEIFHRTLRPRQKSTDSSKKLPVKSSRISKSKKKVNFYKKKSDRRKNLTKDLIADSKNWQKLEIKAEKLDDVDRKSKPDDKNLRKKIKTDLNGKNNCLVSDRKVKIDESIVKVDNNININYNYSKNHDNASEKILNHGHKINIHKCTDNFNEINGNNNSNSNSTSNIESNASGNYDSNQPNVTNKPINIKKECNELSLMDVSVKLEKINVDVDDRAKESERLRRNATASVKSNSKDDSKTASKCLPLGAGGKKRKRKKKKIKKQINNNNNLDNLFENLDVSASSGRVECDLCKKSFVTREVFNLHYCCN
ncbi:uncharacterized protein DDB_G0287625-like [Microplitis mediator]|uniref:uncharacterized protein DDB_G0287625-like n=1 Tax=Microplitis mediator TaxID=375433 RepID=UPI002552CF71|nr:uncharacterized protein DDB_G0287625-like [Microplitis mediator]